jgi:DNA invertase Pin-like site-specific DNA recombinase
VGLPNRRQSDGLVVAARLDRVTRRIHALSQLLEDGHPIRAANKSDVDHPMMRIYAAMAPKEWELISERTRAALGAAKARGAELGRGQGLPASQGP